MIVTIFEDNQGAVALSKNPVMRQRRKKEEEERDC